MGQDFCPNCGANDFNYQNGYKVCKYCNSQFKVEASGISKKETKISLKNDIKILLQKCEDEPWNAKKYAGLILDIDPTNKDVIKYL